jgi:molecular chaperone GrpE
VTDPREQVPEEGPVIRDKRRLDPETGQLREPAAQATAPAAAAGPGTGTAEGLEDGGPADETTQQLAERTADLQRVQAEYTNYRRRVDRDREAVREAAVANVLTNLLPVLDDIGRARDHGELEGGFKSVGEALEATVEKLGLERFGAAGDPFDPTVHEALTHTTSPEVTETTAVEVFQPGYRIGDRIVRPARVAVADPAQPEPPSQAE